MLNDLKLLKNENELLSRKNVQTSIRINKLEAEIKDLGQIKQSLQNQLDAKDTDLSRTSNKLKSSEVLLKEKSEDLSRVEFKLKLISEKNAKTQNS